jgi:hypothetical protein
MLFGKITGCDPRSLGDHECSGFELGIWPAQAAALQTVAFDELAAGGPMAASPLVTNAPGEPARCATHWAGSSDAYLTNRDGYCL